MTTTAQSIVLEAQTFLVDLAGTRFPASLLVRHLNDMQRAIHQVRPDSTAARATLTLVAGHAQSLPATAACLIEILSLSASPKTPVRQAQREILDVVAPGWRAATQTAAIVHYVYDPRVPRVFDVYPPAIVSTTLEAMVSVYPTDVAAPSGAGLVASTVSGNISLADEFKNALIHLVCYRAYMLGNEFANDPAAAQAHLQMAVQDVGESLLSRLRTQPSVATDSTVAAQAS